MKKLLRRLLLGIILGVGVYAGLAVYLGVRDLAASLATFALWRLLPVLALTFTNYLLRYAKWSLYLRVLDLRVPPAINLTIFLGGLSMVVTPGKIGELLKAYLLRTASGVPMTRSAPIVMAERITDLVALVLLMLTGFFTFRVGQTALLLVATMVLVFLAVVSSRRLSLALLRQLARLPGLKGVAPKLEEFYQATWALFRPLPLLVASLLSVVAWFCECLGFFLILGGFPSVTVPLLVATFIYSATTLGGLPTPGGLGLTDGGMTALLGYTSGLKPATAGAATLLIRLCTLWFAVLVGVLALLVFRKRVGLADEAADELARR
ncbi:MAG: flippase-like domain-containing protein [Deltaproteobacteria bacterium]|nr:flippase-like domain-containing protein [Deltaproteobacteria bacterium]